MKVANIRINGMENPVGFDFETYVYHGKFVRHLPEDSRMQK